MQQENPLIASNETFKELIRNSFDTIVLLDENGVQRFVSESCERVHGYKPTELINIPVIEQMIHPDDQPLVMEAFKKIIANGSGGTQYRHKHKKGGWVYLEGFGTNQLENPLIRSVIINVRDITEKKETELALKKSEQQLQALQKLESLGLLAGGIAHDFNNLFSGLFGYIESAIRITKEEPVTASLGKALSVMERARGLTQQLLTFAKGGSPSIKTEPLFPFLKETADFALSGSSVSCTFHHEESLWPCNIDKNQIGQVIDNIIINAEQAMAGRGAIEVFAKNFVLKEGEHPVLSSGNYIKVSIKDQGIGIPKEFLHRIFDPFYSTKPKGHGLGLSTCHSIITKHGGFIEVESESGKGTVFHFYLPASSESSVLSQSVKTTPHQGTGTLLIMDDEKFVREIVGDMVKSMGYSALFSENGDDAVDLFKKDYCTTKKITGMIFDLTVSGGLGGKEALTEIRKLSPTIPVFVSSGYADAPIMAKPTEYGFTASISKPFLTDNLAALLSTHLK